MSEVDSSKEVDLTPGPVVAVPARPPQNPVELLAFAIDKGLDTATLKEFMDLSDRHEANEARKAYAADMVKCQKAMPAIVAEDENTNTSSFYAKLGRITKAITPVYTKNGFSISFGEGVAKLEGDIRITARVLHQLGHFEDFFYDLPPDKAGLRDAVNKTDIHAKGSTTTYGQRYLTKMIFNVAIIGWEDDDGNAASKSTGRLSEDQAMQLGALITDYGLNAEAVLREFAVLNWEQLAAKKFEKALKRINLLGEKRKIK